MRRLSQRMPSGVCELHPKPDILKVISEHKRKRAASHPATVRDRFRSEHDACAEVLDATPPPFGGEFRVPMTWTQPGTGCVFLCLGFSVSGDLPRRQAAQNGMTRTVRPEMPDQEMYDQEMYDQEMYDQEMYDQEMYDQVMYDQV